MDSLAFNVLQRFLRRVFAKAKTPTYTGVFLDGASRHALITWWHKHTDADMFENTHADHMTIKFKPTDEEIERTPLGKQVKLKVIGWAADDKCQAVLVEPEGVASANKHPHITMAVAPGVSPAYSNELLAKGSNRVSGPTLTGVVDARN